ncbi:hypothetical protein LAZ67_4000356 [Cordylochernes scorpioides]|uniref:Uncharacterized protein n=1 Tax=Cordylochernes scorpioides TaxID=51811 RepID=A0ABY6KBH9_9ARAC|nr:hypothetical protein LAZ67_4000356 [Cordylochernes scorpioides]
MNRGGFELFQESCTKAKSQQVKIKILGHQVDQNGIRPDEEKIKAIFITEVSTNMAEVVYVVWKSCEYCEHKFIPKHSHCDPIQNKMLCHRFYNPHGSVKADAAKISKDDPTCPNCHEEDQTVDHHRRLPPS